MSCTACPARNSSSLAEPGGVGLPGSFGTTLVSEANSLGTRLAILSPVGNSLITFESRGVSAW
jgi:hypothetical protein